MKTCLRYGTIALALIANVGLAAAQDGRAPGLLEHPNETMSSPPPAMPSSQLQLTLPQKTAILDAIRQEGKPIASPTNFVVSIGAPVPPQLELYVLPDRALATVPDAKSVKYTMVQDQIVLVDPTTMRVVDVITQ